MKIKLLAVSILLLLALSTSLIAESAAPQTDQQGPLATNAFSWEIKDAKVTSKGKTVNVNGSNMTMNYVIDGIATAKDTNGVIPSGKFHITMTTYTPGKDEGRLKVGHCYVHGIWTITGDTEKTKSAMPSISGTMQADLGFDFTKGQGNLTAKIKLPILTIGDQTVAGEGTLSGNEKLNGTIQGVFSPTELKASQKPKN